MRADEMSLDAGWDQSITLRCDLCGEWIVEWPVSPTLGDVQAFAEQHECPAR